MDKADPDSNGIWQPPDQPVQCPSGNAQSPGVLPLHIFQPIRASADRRMLAARIAEMFAMATQLPSAEPGPGEDRKLASGVWFEGANDPHSTSMQADATPALLARSSSDAPVDGHPNALKLRLYEKRVLVEALRKLPPDRERLNTRLFLSSLAATAPDRSLSPPPAMDCISALGERFPNFAEVVDYLAGRVALANLATRSALQFSPLLLEGSPGIGKTAFAMALSEALDISLLQFPMSHATASFSLGGLDPMYHGGGPGMLVREVAFGRAVDPLVLLDEVDKVVSDNKNDPLGPLYSLWERHTAERFVDEGLKLPLNLSGVRWVATCNDSRNLHPALRSRCEIFRISIPTAEQSRTIVRNIYLDLIQDQPWGPYFVATPSDAVVEVFVQAAPRQMRRRMIDAFARAAQAGRRELHVVDVPSDFDASPRMGFQ